MVKRNLLRVQRQKFGYSVLGQVAALFVSPRIKNEKRSKKWRFDKNCLQKRNTDYDFDQYTNKYVGAEKSKKQHSTFSH